VDEQPGARPARSGPSHTSGWLSVPGARDSGRRLVAFCRRLIRESIEDRLPGLAAEIAFFAVLGVFPALLLASGLLGVLDTVLGGRVGTTSLQRLVDSLDALVTPQAALLVVSVQNLLRVSGGQLVSLATLGGLITISGAFAVVVEALNLAYDAEERRGWLHRRLLGLAMGLGTVLAAALVLSVIVLGPVLGLGRELAELVGLGGEYGAAWTALRVPALAVGLVMWTATLFRLAPSRPGRFRDQLPGAVLTTLLWIVASLGLHLYVTLASRTNPVLGVLGGGLIVLLWAYLLALALLLGGELNATRLRRGRPRGRAGAARDVESSSDPPAGAPFTDSSAPRRENGRRRR
jgi:membrane protein